MNKTDFHRNVENYQQKLSLHRFLGLIIQIFTLGFLSNSKNISYYENLLQTSKIELKEYIELVSESDALFLNNNALTLEGVRTGKATNDNISVIGQEDYGIEWDANRSNILSRDDNDCQESDGYCDGPLQVHHIIPLSKGGTNNESNLVTLCKYHHSLKHDHMR